MDETEEVVESSDSSSSDDEDKELEKRAEELETQIGANKYLYDAHVELVDAYHKLGDLKALREAYTRFHEVYPLTPAIWQSWLRDEMKLATGDADKKYVMGLFEKAVKDYISVDLWLEYAQFAIGFCELEETREILERGLSSVGVHVKQGGLLWDTLRELELAHLSLAEKGTETWRKQLACVIEVFRRQLSVPLLHMESTYEEFKQFKAEVCDDKMVDEKAIEFGYKAALKTLETYKPFESRLLVVGSEDETLGVYFEYIRVARDPSFVVCLYERAVAAAALNAPLWCQYCNHALKLNLGVVTCEKALRNCPWSEELWIALIRSSEYEAKPETDVTSCFERANQALSPYAGVDLWITYLEYTHRKDSNDATTTKLKKLLEQAAELLQESDAFLRFKARILARRGELEGARKTWGEIVYKCGKTAAVWMEYADAERLHGDAKRVRNLYQKALKSCSDWPQEVARAWLLFERETGTLRDVLNCAEKTKDFLNQNVQVAQVSVEKEKKNKKRAGDDTTTDKTKSNNKRIKTATLAPQSQQLPVETFDHEKTVFVSNLPFHVNESRLKELFPNAAKIVKPPDKNGRSRCFAYVCFALPEEAAVALARDREPIDERPMYVSECKQERSQRGHAFKYSTQAEKNKLFVRGLPFVCNQAAVENIFRPYAATSVRLVTKKNGQSKGCAYVDFESEESAEVAMKATDGIQVGELVISVAVSNPPAAGNKGDDFRAREPPPPMIRNARSRLGIKLVPRGVQLKQKKQTNDDDDGGEKEESENGGAEEVVKVSRSNADFRKMFLS